MCGRFQLSVKGKHINERFNVEVYDDFYRPSFNCAPSQNLAVISNMEAKKLSFFSWGLIPFWAKDEKFGNKLINSKAETITEKPSFKNSFRQKRCLVICNGFYEWKKENNKKTPYRIFLKNNELFSMAGIWDTWKDGEGRPINSFSIITTTPNSLMKNIHHRMPVILRKEDEKKWLEKTDQNELLELLKPFENRLMDAYPISELVNSPTNNSPEIIKKIK
jgi:putative SOS response-associated peptidase YedK